MTTRQSECRQSRTTLCELLRNKGNRNVRYSDVVSLQRCRQPRQGTAAEAATACRDNRQQCRNHLLHPPSFYTQPTDSVRYLWTSIQQGEPYWGSREWHPITRYADVLHSLAVIPYTAPLPLSDGDNGERRSQARTVTYLLYHFNPFFMDREQETAQQTEDTKSTGTKRERRDSTISFRVSKTQREHIGRLADKCGMTLSDYVLARSYNYRPKARLTPRQEAVRDELIMARSDYARYTSMLNAMPQEERRAMFRNQTWMVGALQLLGRTAKVVTKLIDSHFSPNWIPETPQIQEQQKQKNSYDR